MYVRSSRGKGQLKCDGTRAETRFRLSAKRTSPFKSAGASVQSTTGSRSVHISGSNAGYTMFPFTSPPVRHRVPSHFNWSLILRLLADFLFTYTCKVDRSILCVASCLIKAALSRRTKGEPWGIPTAVTLLRQARSMQ